MHNKYPNIFLPYRIGNVILKNRIISPSNAPNMLQGPQDYPSEAVINYYAARARGGASIVTISGGYLGGNSTRRDGNSHKWGFDITNGLTQNVASQIAEAIHTYGTRCHTQLITFPEEGYDVSEFDRELNSAVLRMCSSNFKEMPTEMVYEHLERFVKQVKAHAECGFDGVCIHSAYRYSLMARFLSPMTNQRTDEFRGDTFEGRTRLLRLLAAEIKKICGKDFLIEVTMAGYDPVPNGWTIEDSIRFSKEMARLVDIMTIRSPDVDPQHPTGFQTEARPWAHLAAKIKAANPAMAIAASSGLFDPAASEQILAEGGADLLSMARAFISNPNYGNLIREGRENELVPCVRCNKCLRSGPNDPFLNVCTVNPRRGMEHLDRSVIPFNADKKKVAVIGGGPAGITAAIECAAKGHEVHLYEKEAQLGGLMNCYAAVDFKWPYRDYRDYLVRTVEADDKIQIHKGHSPSPKELKKEGFHTVVVAIGATPKMPSIKGIDTSGAVFATDVLGSALPLGKNVVIIGGGEIGVECGIHLAKKGHNVTVLEMQNKLAPEADHDHYYSHLKNAWEKKENFVAVTGAAIQEILAGEVLCRDAQSQSCTVSYDSLVVAAGMAARTDEALEYAAAGSVFHMAGDCRKPASIQRAVR